MPLALTLATPAVLAGLIRVLLVQICRRKERKRPCGSDWRSRNCFRKSPPAAFFRPHPREQAVFSLVAAGLLNKQIAAELGIVEKTVKAHRAQVMTKMGATSLADLVRFAEKLRPPPQHKP